MVTITIQESASKHSREESFWASLNLLAVCGIMLTVSVVWRVIDQFVLGLGSTWMNIMPSKLFPFLILIGFFWRYRRVELGSLLGLSRKQFKAQLAAGVMMVLLISLLIDIGGTVLYAVFLDPTYPLELHILNQGLLGYVFVFFVTNALLEETLFRGLLQNSLKTRMSAARAILLSAIAFGIWHAGWPLVNGSVGTALLVQVTSMIFFTTILGLLFGVYYERFSSGQSLIGPIIAHTFFNFIGESFKVGSEPVIQGPDMVFSTPGLMAISVLMFLGVFSLLFFIFWRYRIEDASSIWGHFRESFLKRIQSIAKTVSTENDEHIEV
jgi:membrane protease YdiL (CAAX protease family)